jgi:hypothetical protein
MADSNKGFSFKKLFIRDTEGDTPDQPIQNIQPQVNSAPQVNTVPQSSFGVKDPALEENFVQRLQNLINQNNQPGFDFLEFTESLFEEKQNPGPEVYKTVFRIAQKIEKSLTAARLLDSARYYKDLVQQTAEAEISRGESKKQGLRTEKDTEKTNLDNSLRDTRAKIQQLTMQIQQLQNEEVTFNNQLVAIDQKYDTQFIDIDRKIGAIRSAKEQVTASIVDIESGIKSNLS